MQINLIKSIHAPVPLATLSQAQLAELQSALLMLGYPVGEADGLIGPKTRNAWAEFKTDVFEGNPSLIGPESIAALEKSLLSIASNLSDIAGADQAPTSKEQTIELIIQECKKQDIGLNTQIAYVLATTQWETAQTFKPVKEAFWKDEEWRQKNFRYFPYYGRGYVQLTWENNYLKYSKLLGIDMVKSPDLALNPKVALFILVHGFKTGTFTGRKITDYINANQTDFINARRCINGTDHAADIAKFAEKFLTSLLP
jgi:hypothetical protein